VVYKPQRLTQNGRGIWDYSTGVIEYYFSLPKQVAPTSNGHDVTFTSRS
jgi:hypothetical protein